MKKLKALKAVILSIFIIGLSLSLSGCVGTVIAYKLWYEFLDTRGLDFYDDQQIEKIYPYGDQLYLVTDDGNCYITGGNKKSQSREYQNAKQRINLKLGIPAPVLFHEGGVKEIIPYADLSALFITDGGDLYSLEDLRVTKIKSGVISAARGSSDGRIYFVDSSNSLYAQKGNRQSFLVDDVRSVRVFGERIFVLTTGNLLAEIKFNAHGVAFLSSAIFENVKSFDIPVSPTGESSGVLINVLTNDGKLYTNGAYSRPDQAREKTGGTNPDEEWKLIAGRVASFDTAIMGTVLIFEDGSASYYGFDTLEGGEDKFGYKLIFGDGISYVAASDNHVMIKRDNAWYFWGSESSLHFVLNNDDHRVLSDAPHVMEVE